MQHLFASFANVAQAERCADALLESGVPATDISVLAAEELQTPAVTQTTAAQLGITTTTGAGRSRGPLSSGFQSGGLIGMGLPQHVATKYDTTLQNGGAILAVALPSTEVNQASIRQIVSRYDGTELSAHRVTLADENVRLPVVEEELQVGKRAVQGKKVGVKVTKKEVPVQEQIHLQDEKIHIERRPVDRPLQPHEEDQAFKEAHIELSETRQEPVVTKTARVTEEVVISKERQDRVETVQDTLLHTEVDIDTDFRNNYNSQYATSGHEYEYYQPAYHYGYNLARDERYRNRSWEDVEAEAGTQWTSSGRGVWGDVKDAVRHGWDKLRGKEYRSAVRIKKPAGQRAF